MYKLSKNLQGEINSVTFRQGNMLFGAPFVPDNTDYAEFKKAVTDGAELQDADGNVMSPEAAQAFVATLP
jgi:hypothetical protein